MCGICGYLAKNRIEESALASMNDTMARRGPNDAGLLTLETGLGVLGFAQRRLSIFDLSPEGHQPFVSADGRKVIVYNGEIYNYRALKKELADYPFRSETDTEVILAAYEKWGMDCLDRFNGMFAFALYDGTKDVLFFARDRMGVKPLYLWEPGDGRLVFGSTLSPIMAFPGFPKQVNRAVLARYLRQDYIAGPDTIFDGVTQVMPGEVISFSREGRKSRFFWTVRDAYKKAREIPVTDYEEARETLKNLLTESVRLRLAADVPIGCFLSGGFDSSLVAALAQSVLGKEPLKTFSVGFSEEAYNEAPYAKAVASFLGCEHTEEIIGEADMLSLVQDLPACFDEPMADSSQIPTMLVSRTAAERVTVALSGDAGDEFFCGYGIYDRVRSAQKLDALGALVSACGPAVLNRLPFKVRAIAENRDPETKTQFGKGGYGELAEKIAGTDYSRPVAYRQESIYRAIGVKDWQVIRMLLDMETYLPFDILHKVDRASMFYSLESRCPLLDVNVMEYAYRIDQKFKYKDGEKKYILKSLAYDLVPRELLDRPKKGFSVPLGKWLAGPLKQELSDYLSPAFLKNQGLFDEKVLNETAARFFAAGDQGAGSGANLSGILWSFFVLEKWAGAYLQG